MRILAIILCLTLIAAMPSFSLSVSAQTPSSRAAQIKKDYGAVAAQIVGEAIVNGLAYDRLAYLTDRIGHRLSGSPQLDLAIKWATTVMKEDGFSNVRAEAVKVPHWVRGKESAEIIAPTKHKLTILGLGGSIGTNGQPLTGEVVVVNSFDQLEKLGSAVKGKIVLYNVAMRKDLPSGPAYGEAVRYRGDGPSRAAKYGAIAALVRSVTTVSLNTPHTGSLRYAPDMPKIPAAAVTIEAAELMQRLTQQGETVKVTLQMEAQTLPDANSANVIAEIPGREKPEEIVLISGHIDSWDVGTGASDDGAGCVIAMEAARLIKKLNLKPRRTIRVVLFTNEENGLRGAVGYGEQHRAEFSKHIAAIEADSGGAKPLGFSFEGKEKGFNYLQDFLPLLRGVEADQLTKGGGGADISILTNTGVPSLGLRPDSSHYFDVHHTEADTLEKIEPINMATNSATLAIMTYLLADMPDPIPRD